jgi:O-antigen ligase
MSSIAAASEGRFSAWCGWVLAAMAALTPLAGWLGPLALAPLLGLAGVMVLPALRITDDDRPMAIALIVLVLWAAGSMIWSPYRPEDLEGWTALKLVVMSFTFWAVVGAARRASAGAQKAILRTFALGMALLGLLLFVEGASHARVYMTLREAIGDPIRPDLAAKNVAVGAFVLVILLPPAAVAAGRVLNASWLALPMAAGVVALSTATGTDAPLFALGAALVTGLAVWWSPRVAPRVLAVLAAIFFMLTPMILTLLRIGGQFAALEQAAPLSWAQRMGYWRHAIAWIGDHPLRGWGLDASRMFAPGIQLHPHDSALQLWLELGVIGATAAAVFFVVLFVRLSRPQPDAAAAAGAATAVAYVTIGAVSFGVWQEWWLALGAFSGAICVVVAQVPAARRARWSANLGHRTSTAAPISE